MMHHDASDFPTSPISRLGDQQPTAMISGSDDIEVYKELCSAEAVPADALAKASVLASWLSSCAAATFAQMV